MKKLSVGKCFGIVLNAVKTLSTQQKKPYRWPHK
jgi:hypothetical protein